MCDACKDKSRVWDSSQKLMVTHFISRLNGKHKLLLLQENDKPQTIIMEIKFCPWCGKNQKKVISMYKKLINDLRIKSKWVDKNLPSHLWDLSILLLQASNIIEDLSKELMDLKMKTCCCCANEIEKELEK